MDLPEAKLTGMDDTTTPMHIVESQQNLLRDLLADVHGHSLVLMPLDKTEKVLSEHLKNHANVGAVGAFMPEVIEEGDDV